MAARLPSRNPRGKYAPLICLNCRSRKIKCHLPSPETTQPSEFPQPSNDACERCQYLGLECIVQKTLLGRPAARRNRSYATTTTGSSVAAESVLSVDESTFEGPAIEDYLLSEVPDSTSPDPRLAPRVPKNANEAFEALVSPHYLLSALLSNDRRFAASIPSALNPFSIPLIQFVSAGLAALLDESLVWVRFYQPSAPHLTDLRQRIVSAQLNSPNKSADISDCLLFALLCLIALDVPSSRLRQDRQLYRNLQTAACHHGQVFIFSPPPEFQSLLILELLSKYRATTLIISQSVAAATLKTELYVSLSENIAERLAAKCSQTALTQIFDGTLTEMEAEKAMLEGLQWCTSVIYSASHGGLIPSKSSISRRLASQIEGIAMMLPNVLGRHPQKPSIVYQYHRVRAAGLSVQYMTQAKAHWRDMEALTNIIDAHKQECLQHRNDIRELLRLSGPPVTSNEEIIVATSLLETDIQQSLTHVSGISLFYTMMHTLKSTMSSTNPSHTQPTDNDEIHPSEATQVSDQVIRSLKEIRLGHAASVTAFLTIHGDARITRMETILSNFASTLRDLHLEGVAYLPQPGTTALQILSICRELVENSAARMKGWGGLHPGAEQHLSLFDGCAAALESMSVPIASRGGGDKTSTNSELLAQAFGRGCLYAASAKLIRGLHRIVEGWRSKVAAAAAAADEANQMSSWTFAEIDGQSTSTDTATSYDSSLLEMDFDELFGQWSNWPHADTMDFSHMVLD